MGRLQKKEFSPDGKFSYSFWRDDNAKKPPLVLLPGFTGTHGDLTEFAEQFKKDFDVIIPDLPGWGDSPKGNYHLTIDGYAKFVYDLLSSLSLEGVYLAGHCMGSTIAIEFTYTYPKYVRELFLIGVPYLEGEWSNEMFEHLAHISTHVPRFLRPFLFIFRSRFFTIPLGFFVIQTKSLRKKLSIIFHNSIKQQFQDEDLVEKNWNSLVLFDYKKLQKIHIPIHLFHGEKDLLVPQKQAKRLHLMCPKTTLEIIPHAGHMPPVETPGSLATAVKKYL